MSVAGQLGAVDSPNQPTIYGYDILNNLLTVQQTGDTAEECGGAPNCSQTRTFVYDSLSRLRSAKNPESGLIQYVDDSNGNLTSKVDARSITTSYVYDALNRVANRNYTNEPSGSETMDVSYFYDNLPNAKGRLIKVSSSVSTTEYTEFDILGRVKAHKQTTDGTAYTTGYTYNLSGALIEETYPSGRVVKNVLDNNGDLETVKSKKDSSFGFHDYAKNFTYNAAGAVTSMQLGNGRWESTVFNSRLQPTQIALGTVQNGTDKLDLDFTYGATANNGNVLSQIITVPTVGSNPGFVATQTYSYDSLNRLLQATETIPNQTGWNQTFSYDRYGNRNFVEAPTTTLLKQCNNNTEVCPADRPKVNPSVDAAKNRLIGYAFDDVGNTTTDAEVRTFVYDAENKQVSVSNSNGTIGQYFYDGDGKRVKKYVPGTGETTIFVYDAAGKLVAEYSTTVEPASTAKVAYLTNDHLGSPRINTDAIGQVISRRDFMPFGEEITRASYGVDSVRQKFTGYERDREIELDYAKARMYSSIVGRFTTTDPSQRSVDRMSPQTWNRYTYCYNNPLTLVDENGKWPTGTHGKIVDHALKGIEARFREAVKLGSRRTDYDRKGVHTLVEANAPQHAMMPGSWVREHGVAKAKEMAKEAAMTFINNNLDKAKQLFAESQQYKPGSDEGVAKLKESLQAFGAAAHVIMDNVSPAHRGFQIYDNQSSFVDGALKGAGGGLSGMLGAGVGQVAADQTNHALDEQREPDEDEYDVMSDRIRVLFKEVYGQDAYQNLDKEERRKTESRKTTSFL